MPRGRRTKYTKDVLRTIVDAVRLGETYRGACMAGGISEETFYTWRTEKPEFSEALTRAESEHRRICLARIERAAAGGNANAAMWILERRYPNEFGRYAVELSGPDGGAIRIEAKPEDYPFLVDDEARAAASQLMHTLARAESRTNGSLPHDD